MWSHGVVQTLLLKVCSNEWVKGFTLSVCVCIQHAVYTGVAAVGGVITLLSFWWSEPPLAPAASAVKSKIPFLSGLKKTLTSPAFLCLMVVWGCGSGLFNALLTLLAQILCPYGYSDVRPLGEGVCVGCDCVCACVAGEKWFVGSSNGIHWFSWSYYRGCGH